MLSAAQMGRMSRLLAQALELEPEGLQALGHEDQDLEDALRRALLPEDGEAAGAERSVSLAAVGVGF